MLPPLFGVRFPTPRLSDWHLEVSLLWEIKRSAREIEEKEGVKRREIEIEVKKAGGEERDKERGKEKDGRREGGRCGLCKSAIWLFISSEFCNEYVWKMK